MGGPHRSRCRGHGEEEQIRAIDLGAPTVSAELPALCDRLRSLPVAGPGMVVTCDLAGLSNPDCATVEGLARLQLTARRLGCTVRLRNASDELHDLLALVGLCDVVGLCSDAARAGCETPRLRGSPSECLG